MNSQPARPRSARTAPEAVTFGETMAALRAHSALRLGGSLGLFDQQDGTTIR
ncbi:hypothetical protein [Streptomyces himastatinicus]|uniref:hypothetical protein n=1 Tax=Streptomyces himastatinicus TaxID=998084 RepID=UPI0002E9099D|nr:hypothetical protein [Streptomyces himastatinicus]